MTKLLLLFTVALVFSVSCSNTNRNSGQVKETKTTRKGMSTFEYDSSFLARYTQPVFLSSGKASLAVSPEYQGRVMTSTADGPGGLSFGWVNYDLIASGRILEKINPVGGEDRLWLGPEGGQYSLFFPAGSEFVFENWKTPAVFDSKPFTLLESNDTSALFRESFQVSNYAGTVFDMRIDRRVTILDSKNIKKEYGISPVDDLSLVGYKSVNQITNTGSQAWKRETGLVSIWILGMYVPSPSTVIFAPYKNGPDDKDKPELKTSYFGTIPPENLKVTTDFVFFKADGKYRSKIGIPPAREGSYIAAYDPDNHILTVVRHNRPPEGSVYVNSLWKMQEHPYGGDVVNAYNDGPLEDNSQLGPFYELETSSPGAELAPMESLVHIEQTVHFTGDEAALDKIAVKSLGISLGVVKNALK